MKGTKFGRIAVAGFLCAGAFGCATTHAPHDKNAAHDSLHVPLALRGDDVIVQIDLPNGKQTISPGEFQKDEICYMSAGQFRIDCYKDGSSLNLGPTDSNDLLLDNPGSNLQPADDEDEDGRRLLQISSVLMLVAGSIDRLPGTLSDYIQNPGQHMAEALDLTESLLTQDKVRFAGYAHGGNFNVTVELTDAGREKLEDALDEAGESNAGLQQVIVRRPARLPTH